MKEREEYMSGTISNLGHKIIGPNYLKPKGTILSY